MGARSFLTVGSRVDPEHAFWDEVSRALAAYGRDGYTGTIAEKFDFEIYLPPPTVQPLKFGQDLEAATFGEPLDRLAYLGSAEFADALDTYGDKWGPAIAIPGVRVGEWLFCGLAPD